MFGRTTPQKQEPLTQGEFFQAVRQNSGRHGFGVYKEGPHVVLRRIDGTVLRGCVMSLKTRVS